MAAPTNVIVVLFCPEPVIGAIKYLFVVAH